MGNFIQRIIARLRRKKNDSNQEQQFQTLLELRQQMIDMLEQKKFNIEWLDTMNFGNAAGERDKNLEKTFLQTRSIKEIATGEYNYILAPKGCGKSSVFKAYTDRFKDIEEIQNADKNIIVSINQAFSYENALNNRNLLDKSEEKRWAVFWGIYLLKKILEEISKPAYECEFRTFLKENRKYEELKEEFQLYDIWDYLEKVKVALTFNLQGQEISVAPSIKKANIKKNISLNSIFEDLQDVLQELDMRIFILIDRVDDFVVGEEQEKQRKYIQGLYNCVEEVCLCRNIIPILFLRTDLYYNLKIGTGSDKIQIRTLNLEWKKQELISFMALRLLNSNEELISYQGLPIIYTFDVCRDFMLQEGQNEISEIVAKDMGVYSKTSRKIINTFLPQTCKHKNSEGVEEKMDFIDWIYTHFEDYTRYINLRYVIVFFNKLFKEQYNAYEQNCNERHSLKVKYDEENAQYYYKIFSDQCIMKCYNEVQKIAINNIKSLLGLERERKCFEELHFKANSKRGNFNFGDIQFGKYELTKDEYEDLLHKLEVLGYLKSTGKRYSLPILYQCEMETWC